MRRKMTTVHDPIARIRTHVADTPPTSLGLTQLADGFVDLRNLSLATPPLAWAIRVGQGSITRRPTRPVFERLTLEKIDLCGSKIGESLWEDVQLRSVRFTNADLHNADFSSGIIEDVSFVDANLEGSIWGMQGLDGPRVSGVDFSGAKMFPSTYGHPLFRNCLFSRAKLDGVNFRSSRFEYCVFEGIMRNVQFRGCSDDPNPIVAALRN